jgi:RNA polymerase sigma-70 factor (ECF subfamily)
VPVAEPSHSTPVGFEAFFREHYARLARAEYLVTGSRTRAEDLAQEAMLRVLQRWDQVVEMESPEGYLFKVGFNLGRREGRRASSEYPVSETSEFERLWIPSVQDADEDPTTTRIDILRALDALTFEQRQAVVLVLWLDMSAKDAANVLGIDEVSVRTRLHRARPELRRYLEVKT